MLIKNYIKVKDKKGIAKVGIFYAEEVIEELLKWYRMMLDDKCEKVFNEVDRVLMDLGVIDEQGNVLKRFK